MNRSETKMMVIGQNFLDLLRNLEHDQLTSYGRLLSDFHQIYADGTKPGTMAQPDKSYAPLEGDTSH